MWPAGGAAAAQPRGDRDMTRREFLKAGLAGAAALVAYRWLNNTGAAEPPPPTPPSVVGLARADHLYLPGPVYAPPGVYPEGKLDWQVVDLLVRDSARLAGFPSPWPMFAPTDRVAVMVDAAEPAVPLITVEAVLEQLVQAGLAPERLFIFAAREADLFAAGFSLSAEGPTVRAYGADAAGYRGGFSRLVLDRCDKIVNLARLRPHPRLGMTGVLYNYLNAMDPTTRFAVLESPEQLGAVAARRQLADKMALHFLDCTHPFYRLPQGEEPKPKWEYRGLLCGRDPVAVDVVGRQILEAKRAEVAGQPCPLEPAPAYLEVAAKKWKVGQAEPDQIRLEFAGDRREALISLPEPPPPPPE